jgi:glycosyltransferase involved in cell wall biosynthesis
MRIFARGATDRTLRLVLAGPTSPDEHALFSNVEFGAMIEHHGVVTHAEAMQLQRDADCLLLLTSDDRSAVESKLFEYLGARRPIVALARNNEAARIVQETGTGITVPPDDVEAIVDALGRVASGELERQYAPRGLERYRYPAPAESMAEVIEDAIRRRRAPGTRPSGLNKG